MKHGIAFPEHIKTEKIRRLRFQESDVSSMRVLLPLFFLIGLVILFVLRLSYLQLLKGNYYRDLSDANRTRTKIIHAPRGVIFDRNGAPLVFNLPGFRQMKGDKSIVLSKDEALSRLAQGARNIEVDSLRQYPDKEAIGHILGYIGQITINELSDRRFSSYEQTDWIGKDGIEKTYEDELRGVNGKELIEVDAMGKEIRQLGRTDAIPGKDLTLSVDKPLQLAVYAAMRGVKKGAAIVSTPQGEILALVSKPSFDPNLFTLDASYKPQDEYGSVDAILNDDTGQPLLNRAIGGMYPPGSTFKLVTAAAGLETNVINERYTINDTGILHVGDFSFANWYFTDYGRTDGEVDVVKAIRRSNDIFFYKVGNLLGVDKLSAFARKFGLGGRLGIDLEGEAEGLIPTKAWKQKTFGENWYLGDDYHYGIGQGYVLTTPLQVNSWTATIANGGILYQPHLLQNQKSKIKNQKFLSEKSVSLIRQGMVEACSPGGVAWPLFDFKVKNEKLLVDGRNIFDAPQATTSANFKDYRHVVIACKTGTAQHGGEDTKPHAWITLFAPAYNPQIVVTVLSEESGEGSSVAGPIAKKILEAWFGKR
ncbi:MAG: penicillin-binding transpeptidase domain-containing protein [bacterium]|nr:penicillin-binding transpeptidase domain-containing protein [bacterium]